MSPTSRLRGRPSHRGAAWLAATAWAVCALAAHSAPATKPAAPASVVLVTLDTTRADAVGVAGGARFRGGPARTPRFDALAKTGVRFARALAPSPLTLPAHASLFTGLEPREHGLRDNGGARLPAEPPTLAAVFAASGYRTGAFVASRVLDHRFGLGRGFEVYDDRMAAEQVGESGDPERDAVAVTTAALAWTRGLPAGTRFFLWVHYYDAHSPYAPPAELAGDGSVGARYAGEVALVDRELGRLLDGLPGSASGRLIAVVGDHGESLGEHGEPGHGVLLHRATLEVPLVIAGPGVPAGRVVAAAVGTRRLAATLVQLAGIAARPGVAGTPLPLRTAPAAEPIYSETFFPANAYGWSPLRALTLWPWRLVVGRRGELFDLEHDAEETRDQVGVRRDVARRLKSALESFERAHPERRAPPSAADPELEAALRSLGYTGGSGATAASGSIDPRDGVHLLAALEEAKAALAAGRCAEARPKLEELVRRSPGNRTFLFNLAAAHLACRDGERAAAVLRAALALDPQSAPLHASLAEAHVSLGQTEAARRELELALRIDPRMARAWLRLAELAGPGALEVLRRAVAAEADSAKVWVELGKLEVRTGDRAAAARAFAEACRVEPRWALAWRLRGELADLEGRLDEARQHYLRAAGADPRDAVTFLRLGALTARLGDPRLARSYLERAATIAPGSAEAVEARRLLGSLDD